MDLAQQAVPGERVAHERALGVVALHQRQPQGADVVPSILSAALTGAGLAVTNIAA